MIALSCVIVLAPPGGGNVATASIPFGNTAGDQFAIVVQDPLPAAIQSVENSRAGLDKIAAHSILFTRDDREIIPK